MSSKKIAAAIHPPVSVSITVREYDERRDKSAVEELERRCEVGQSGKPTLVTDLIGDPVARVRNFTSHVMLVAEHGDGREIVGVIRGCIKTVTSGKLRSNEFPIYVKLAYILGLRVSSSHRRLGIATKLVLELEGWCKQNGAEYAYMATECSNKPSLSLFTQKSNYVKFRNPTVLVQPVHGHYKSLSSDVVIVRVSPNLAETMYRTLFSNSEFFPKDVDVLLHNKLNLGTFIVLPKRDFSNWNPDKDDLPSSFSICSIWNTKEVYRLQLKGVSALTQAVCMCTRVVDAMFPWLMIPSIPNLFKKFGFYFLYGLHMEGEHGSRLMKTLCKFAHNMARNDRGCRAVVAEVGQTDPVREAIPHWRKFSWDEDIWCIKKLQEDIENKNCDDPWLKSSSISNSKIIFVDPRDL